MADPYLKVMMIASGDLWAGAEAVVYQLAKGLHETNNVRLTMVLLNQGRLAALCKDACIRTYVLEEGRLGFIRIALNLINIARYIQPDIIHTHRYKENILAGLIAPVVNFPQQVITVHGLAETGLGIKSRMIKLLNTMLMRMNGSRIITVSHELRLRLMSMGIPESYVRCIHNGVVQNEPALKPPRSSSVITIGSAGRLVPVKDYAMMIDVAHTLCNNRADIRFILAGNGPEMDKLQKKVKDCNLEERFKLIGHVDDLTEFYEMLDIFINTSYHEGIPMTILEAMSHSIPIVAPAVGGITEIVDHNRNGCLIMERNICSFVSAIERIIDTPQLIQKMGENAREKFDDEFSATCMVQEYHSFYREILLR